ncbi:MAG: phytanoyl-CoA dioxygenase family protein [Anaerolineae bacterium]|nr:phytanoyl-CoA dioxygenase family protein [Anaerolineae bacterium]
MLTDMDTYLFDLRGFLLLKNALSTEEVAAINAGIDRMLPLERGEWYGHVHGHSFGGGDEGLNLQQIYEGGEPFERLIDHPSWIDKVKYFVGGEGTFDYNHGPLFIDENFANVRGPGQAIGLHSGGHEGTKRTQFRFHNGRFQCGQINILMALTDIGPGDGATMVVPGSHKANLPHPEFDKYRMGSEEPSVDHVTGAIEIHMAAGDAILFVDAISHGSAKRVNPGNRRIIVFRYGPSWGSSRHGYRSSEALLNRLTPERRQIVHPQRSAAYDPDKDIALKRAANPQ